MRNKTFLALVLPFLVLCLTGCEPQQNILQRMTCVKGHDEVLHAGGPIAFVCDEYRPTSETIAPAGRD